MSSYADSFNPPEDLSTLNTVINQSPIQCDDSSISVSSSTSEKRTADIITPSRRKKAKKFVDTTNKFSNIGSMYGVMLKRGFSLLFCEVVNNSKALN